MIAAISLLHVWLASTIPLLVVPLLSWISSTATMSGALRLLTKVEARRANLLSGSLGARFSTLNDAIASSLLFGDCVVSGCRLPVAVAAASG